MQAPEIMMARTPDRIIAKLEDGGIDEAQILATEALYLARFYMPKVTGRMASTLQPLYGEDHWGIYFPDRHTWFLEQGTSPFTMNSLAGKVIPMWVDDPTGETRKENPKAKVRRTMDGRVQVQIFRRAARKGQRKSVMRKGRMVSVPMSYPGAPGRISVRNGGQIGGGNGGVRWRHPGISPRHFLNSAMTEIALQYSGNMPQLYLVDAGTYTTFARS